MSKGRLEAFSDGVMAILITIMVLELKVPAGSDWAALRPILPTLLAYILSFVLLGIYWTNHHHMLHVTERINGRILWANLHLLFWLSLVTFVTGWLGENSSAPLPAAVYGAVALLSALAWKILQGEILTLAGPHSRLASAIGGDAKGNFSLALYAAALPLAFVHAWIAEAIYAAVALIWLVPDRRIESKLNR